MVKPPTIREVMTPSPKTLPVNETILNAKRLMNKYSIRHIPVTDKGEPVAILSDRIIKVAEAVYGKDRPDCKILVRDICVFDPYTVSEDAPLDKALMEMANRRIGSALVMHEGKLTGILTTVDICRAFAAFLHG